MSGEANHDAASGEANLVAASDQAVAEAGVSAASPEVRVVKGNPSDEDLAALVAVLTAAQGGSADAGTSRPPELWGSPTLLHRGFAPQSAYSYAASGRHRG
ncbi:acyl-CoA carboxylase epsilon subunit [Rhodococcus sp. NPDC078407]|uniref:acyl-CoA carboxylase epsilon subunit n=1 Tax=Rhodococcus sp. NPDC078407 TaxID=3364509 RepID=UPI0037C76884